MDSSPSVTSHVAYSRVCYSSNPDERLSSCGVTVKRQEAVKPTQWSERPYFINNLSPYTLFNAVREFSSVVSYSHFPWVANHLAHGISIEPNLHPHSYMEFLDGIGIILQETYKHIGFTLTTLNLSFGNHWLGLQTIARDIPSYSCGSFTSMKHSCYYRQQQLSEFSDHCSFCGLVTVGLVTVGWFSKCTFSTLPSLDQRYYIPVSSISCSLSCRAGLYPAHWDSVLKSIILNFWFLVLSSGFSFSAVC